MVKTKKTNVKKQKTKKRKGGSRPILIGYYQLPAYKTPSEDRISLPLINEYNTILGVFDGHSGHDVVDIIYNELPKRIQTAIGSLQNPDLIEELMIAEFEKIDRELEHSKSGSTATVAVILENHIIVANVGDSPAILFTKEGKLIAQTTNHDCNNKQEERRVKKAGGICIPDLRGLKRLRSGLAVTRSFGDFVHNKSIVIAKPQTYIWPREPDTLLGIMSDSFTETIVKDYLGREIIMPTKQNREIVKEIMETLEEKNFDVESGAKRAVEKRVRNLDEQGDNTSLILAYM
jgi:serine/threonine protein phosphatase PrpC